MLLEESITCVRIAFGLNQMLYIWHIAKICKKQDVGSTILWQPRFRNYKSHVKKNVRSCKITNHFMDERCDEEIPFQVFSVCNYRRG